MLHLIRNAEYIGDNVSDHRLIEYKFLEKMPNIKFIRATLTDVYRYGELDSQKRFIQ